MKDLTQVAVGELLEWLANARTTGAQALGHSKSAMNDFLVKSYKQELERRSVPVPTDDELYAVGKFNGKGST